MYPAAHLRAHTGWLRTCTMGAVAVVQELAAAKGDGAGAEGALPAGATLGVIELGGASMQLTFMPQGEEKLPDKFASKVDLPGRWKGLKGGAGGDWREWNTVGYERGTWQAPLGPRQQPAWHCARA